ncbi:MAG: glycosyltransferase [Thermoflexibacter sp.]|nr:glycosyltransferase [Thermoflexibacter sp.]
MKSNQPKITIITPSYNQGQYLEATIQSILNQGYPSLEYFIFDGGSTDNSLQIIEKYKKKITYWESEKDRGQSHAINKGFAKATGDIITWINSDDQLTPNALDTVAKYFALYPHIGFLHGKTILIGNGKETIKGADSNDLNIKYLAGLPFPQPSAFFSRKLIEDFGYLKEAYHYGMDYDFFLQAFLSYEVLALEEVLSKYLLHENSKTVSQASVFAKDYAKIFSRLLRSFSFTSTLIHQMQSLGMYEEGSDTYLVKKSFSPQDIELAFCYNLRFQLTFYYESGETVEVNKITSFLKKYYPSFYKKDQELAKVHFRTKFLNKEMLQLLRVLFRK